MEQQKQSAPDFNQQIEALMPQDEMMHSAWLGCLSYVLGDPDRRAEFQRDTGLNWEPPASPIERMIDDATGVAQQFFLAVARWMNANVWGELNGRAVNGDEPEPCPPGGQIEGAV